MSSLRFRILFAGVTAFLVAFTAANAEKPAQSREQLLESASHAMTGTVMRTYERHEQKDDRGFEWTNGVAEINVTLVNKGSDIELGDRAFVRYWQKKMGW